MTGAERIKVLCVRQGISISELARRLGKSPQNFSAKIKRDNFTVEDFEKIAQALDCTYENYFVLPDGDHI